MYRLIMDADAIIIAGPSALRGIRAERARASMLHWKPVSATEQGRVLATSTPRRGTIDHAFLERLGFISPDEPMKLHLMVGDTVNRRRIPGVLVSVRSSPLPSGSILHVTDNVYCCSPFLIARDFARTHTAAETTGLLMELMGGYTLPPEATLSIWEDVPWIDGHASRESVQQAHVPCEPALTPHSLRGKVARLKSSTDRTLVQAARCALPNSNSPMETVMAALFAAPGRMGGFSCRTLPDGMHLNRHVHYSGQALIVAKMPYAICDVLFPGAETEIEYNGGDHTSEQARIHDENRNTALGLMGIHVIILNKVQMRDVAALEEIARTLHQRAGKPFRQHVDGTRVRQAAFLNGLRSSVGLPPT